MKKHNVLILCPHLSEKGGVAHYYTLVKNHFKSEKIALTFYYTGKFTNGNRHRNRVLKTVSDFFSLMGILAGHELVVLNPSLDPKAVIRDGMFNVLAKRIFRKKTMLFFRGWAPNFEKAITRSWKRLFKVCFCSDRILVLSKPFREVLVRWGFNDDIIRVETTAFERYRCGGNQNRCNIIFLSRLVSGKGCMEAVDAMALVADEFPEVKLFMVGDGALSQELKTYVSKRGLDHHVEFTGWLEGEQKYRLLSQCGIMLLPSCSEGMPNSLLEGMGMGLAIVSRPVGGIPEIVTDGDNGFLVESLRPADFADKLRFLLSDKDAWEKISLRNRRTAEKKFEIQRVVKRLEQHCMELMP